MQARSMRRFWFALFVLLGAVGVAGLGLADSRADAGAPIQIEFSLDRPIDAAAAPLVLASTRGLFRAEGLNVTTTVASDTTDAIARVAVGTSELALADLNALIRFRDQPGVRPVKAVFVLFDKAAYAFIARKSRGINALADIEGKTVGVTDGDLSIRLWPALARKNGLQLKTVKLQQIGPAVREPMLSAGQLDAISGLSYLSAIDLRDRGIPADDLTVLRFADYGCAAYGKVLIVNPEFAADKPEAVKAFVRAVIAGLRLTIKAPEQAVDDVLAQMDNGSRAVELERLHAVLSDNILTSEVRHSGIGDIDPARFETSLDQIADDFKFRKRPAVADIFDDSFLPPAGDRKVTQAE
ncbi:ABC-type nitrate/sulfonate/bicarbonate transport systems periplasmic component [Nitrobacter hamburgensis X14]|uniref:ABC-type nitrate/sulfonate/bicarbonate transport systems periplasmic component n=1 Tax=Nitrobacter hamburgensis (strain DSM 10229 / NCIMB 13809 / X14) TaxID=323097 RepID=Q1QH36_NITHX|nr:ABC-type nitrate/sulfonate/bicarbonate transport systems periplasmic component [Nitrobacter hamburgensis X14]